MPLSRLRAGHERKREGGAALFIAIALLGVFTLLGIYYVNYMLIETDAQRHEIKQIRARLAAEAGIQAALADLRHIHGLYGDAGLDGDAGLLDRTLRYDVPVYERIQGAPAPGFDQSDVRKAHVSVTLTDESSRINLNHAPPSVLQLALGVDGATARAIVGSLPRSRTEQAAEEGAPAAASSEADAETPGAAWLIDPKDLVSRGFLTPEAFAEIDPAWITTESVLDHDRPWGHLNINRAPARVLAAALDIPEETAETLIEARPFSRIEAVAEAAGKPVATFNYRTHPWFPDGTPPAFTLETRALRVTSTGVLAETRGVSTRETRYTIEAVVHLDEDGRWTPVSWRGARGGAAAAPDEG